MARVNGGIKVRGDIRIDVFDRALKKVVRTVQVKNRIVQTGLNALPYLLAQRTSVDPEPSTLRIETLRVGTGTALAQAGDIGLGSELSAFTVTLQDENFTADAGTSGQLTVSATLDSDLTGAGSYELTEAGLFMPASDAYTNGRLFARQTHASVTTGTGLVLNYTWTLTFTAA